MQSQEKTRPPKKKTQWYSERLDDPSRPSSSPFPVSAPATFTHSAGPPDLPRAPSGGPQRGSMVVLPRAAPSHARTASSYAKAAPAAPDELERRLGAVAANPATGWARTEIARVGNVVPTKPDDAAKLILCRAIVAAVDAASHLGYHYGEGDAASCPYGDLASCPVGDNPSKLVDAFLDRCAFMTGKMLDQTAAATLDGAPTAEREPQDSVNGLYVSCQALAQCLNDRR